MPTEQQKAEKQLYAGMPRHVQELHQSAKKLDRGRKRAQWQADQARQNQADFAPRRVRP